MSNKSILTSTLIAVVTGVSVLCSAGCLCVKFRRGTSCDGRSGVRMHLNVARASDRNCQDGSAACSGLIQLRKPAEMAPDSDPGTSHSGTGDDEISTVWTQVATGEAITDDGDYNDETEYWKTPKAATANAVEDSEVPQEDSKSSRNGKFVDAQRNLDDLKKGWELPEEEPLQTLLAEVPPESHADVPSEPQADVPSESYAQQLESVEAAQADEGVVPLDEVRPSANKPIVLHAKVVKPLIQPLPDDVRQADGRRLNPGKPVQYAYPKNENPVEFLALPAVHDQILPAKSEVPGVEGQIAGDIPLRAVPGASEYVESTTPQSESQTAESTAGEHPIR